MLRLLTAISVVFGSVVLAQAQSQLAPGPAAPGGPNPYGIGPGGVQVAPGSGSSTTTPAPSVAPEGTNVRREEPTVRRDEPTDRVERRSVKRRAARVSRQRSCWRCGRYGWAYTGRYYLWPSPYYAGGSEWRYNNYYARRHWGPPYVGGYLAEIVPFRVYGR
ncbi:MAG: hypothetical protein R3D52_01095 [Xanthobacteraceae bacterium]